jgi:ABC-2 type transport system permease protein
MPSKGIMQPPQTRPGGSWRDQPDTGPSVMRGDEPMVARGIALVGVGAIVLGGMALALQTAGRATPMGLGWATFLLTVGIGALLFHAAFDRDVQYRRLYMGFGYLCLAVGGFLAVVPYDKVGALFGQGYLCLFLGLLFLLAFLRNEDDAWMRTLAENVIGGAGAIMVLVGLIGGNVKGDFLLPIGLLLALLGVIYLTAFVGSRGIGDNLAYRAGLGLGALGVLVFLVALGRSLLPPLFYRWHWTQMPPPAYFVPYGAVLTVVGVLYVCISLLMCSENRLVVMTRRELGSLFYSPIAYVVLFVYVFFHWYAYFMVILNMLNRDVPWIEPIVRNFILQWPNVIATVVVVPVLTMRLLSEEKRSGTLEVLLTAPVDEPAVVVSKFLAAWMMYLVMWLPFALFLIYFRIGGGAPFDYHPMFSFTVGLAATGAAFVSMGVFFSSLTRSQIASGLLSVVGMLGLTVVYILGDMLGDLAPSSNWVKVLKHMSYIDVWLDTLRGRLLPLQILFFLSLAVVWLFLSVKVLEARKWT